MNSSNSNNVPPLPRITLTQKGDDLHKRGLAWFAEHPDCKEFLRDYVPGELDATMEAEFLRKYGELPILVYSKHIAGPVTGRIPIWQRMIEAMKKKGIRMDELPHVTF